MNETVRTYLKDIADTENYLQLMKDLIIAATGSDNKLIWEKSKTFCSAEVVENMSFIVSVAREMVDYV